MEERLTQNISREFNPRDAGRVFKLSPDWSKLIETFPKLNSSASVFRGHHTILCQCRKFPTLSQYDEFAFRTEGARGITLRTDHWSEAWWYHEEREGRMCPCLEVADSMGQGIFKLCYRYPESAQNDMPRIYDLVHSEGDAWDILHLRRANTMDCSSQHRAKANRFQNSLLAIFQEAFERSAQLGIVVSQKSLAVWDCLPPARPGSTCCWLTAGGNRSFLNLQVSEFRDVDLSMQKGRMVAVFQDQEQIPGLTLLEPYGIELKSLRALKSRHS